MGIDGDVTRSLRAANMAGDALMIMEDLHHAVGEPHLGIAADHGGKGRVRRRLEPQRLCHTGLQVVADDRLGDAAKKVSARIWPSIQSGSFWLELVKAKVRLDAPSTATKIRAVWMAPVMGSITGTIWPE